MVGLVVVVAGALISIGYVRARENAVERVQERMNDFSDRLVNRLAVISGDTATFVNIFASAANSFLAPATERLNDKLVFAREALLRSPTVDGLYAGYPDGSFFHAINLRETLWRKALEAPKEAMLAVRTIDRSQAGTPVMRVLFLDGAGKRMQAERTSPADFDPRNRLWYQKAEGGTEAVTTGPYEMAVTGALGMTISQGHIRNPKVVIGADVVLTRVTNFLRGELLTTHSVAFIADDTGRPVIHSSLSEMQKIIAATRDKQNGTDAKIDPLTRGLSRLLKAQDGRVDAVSINDVTYIVMSSKITTSQLFAGNTLVIAAPLEEILGPAYNELFQGLAVAGGVVVVVIVLALVLAGVITQSLNQLTTSAYRLQELDFQTEINVPSRVREISALSGAMSRARDAIFTFSLYVPKELVRKGIESGEFSRRTAARQEVTALFTDIYNFTAISEQHSPEEVVIMLSEYFDLLNVAVNRHDGTIIQFLGDSIFAMWNAPINDDRHAEKACRAALAMQQALENFNALQVGKGLPEFRTRFGIHTGAAVVGSVGAADRLQYTAMGDTINVASRLEGMNKEHGTTILASRAVHEHCHDVIQFRPLGQAHAKGRAEEVELYEVIGEIDEPATHQ
ncbi:adenylate/guanylate cyclase domain-containing protein [Rhizobium sp. TH2]|nr:adenylate/guanylate cyclase domain-containing protein [Rhizobium sp. TH2]